MYFYPNIASMWYALIKVGTFPLFQKDILAYIQLNVLITYELRVKSNKLKVL